MHKSYNAEQFWNSCPLPFSTIGYLLWHFQDLKSLPLRYELIRWKVNKYVNKKMNASISQTLCESVWSTGTVWCKNYLILVCSFTRLKLFSHCSIFVFNRFDIDPFCLFTLLLVNLKTTRKRHENDTKTTRKRWGVHIASLRVKGKAMLKRGHALSLWTDKYLRQLYLFQWGSTRQVRQIENATKKEGSKEF